MSIIIHNIHSVKDFFESYLCNYFENLENEIPSIVLTPYLSTNSFLKNKLIENGINLINVNFFLPNDLRNHLLSKQKLEINSISNANLQVLLSSICNSFLKDHKNEKILENSEDSSNFYLAKRYLENNETILNYLLTWHSYFNNFEFLPNSFFKKIAVDLDLEIKKRSQNLTSSIDEKLFNCSSDKKFFNKFIIFGFSEKHCYLRQLISAVANCSDETVACFSENISGHDFFSHKFEERIHIKNSQNFQKKPKESIVFPKTFANACDSICLEILKILENNTNARIGIIFPSKTSAIARQISINLSALEINHWDSFGYLDNHNFWHKLIKKWIIWQESTVIDDLNDFIIFLAENDLLSDSIGKDTTKAFRLGFEELLTPDSEILLTFSKNRFTRKKFTSSYLENYFILPENGTFGMFFEKTRNFFADILNFSEEISNQKSQEKFRSFEIEEIDKLFDEKDFFELKDCFMSKNVFLKWLKNNCKEIVRLRSNLANQIYSNVHILSAEEAINQSWTDLILCDLNFGLWPEFHDMIPFFEDAIRKQNEKKSSESNAKMVCFGKNEDTIFSKHSFWKLLKMPENSLFLFSIINTKSHSSKQENISSNLLSPLIFEYYENRFQQTLNFKTIEKIQDDYEKQNSDILSEIKNFIKNNFCENNCINSNNTKIEQTKIAYENRQNSNIPFNEYTFATDRPVKISAKAWEESLLYPERSWFAHILKISHSSSFAKSDLSQLAIGNWVHSWINLQNNDQKISFEDWKRMIFMNSQRKFHEIRKIFSDSSKILPDYLVFQLSKAKQIAINILENIHKNDFFSSSIFFTEIPLLKTSQVLIPGNKSITIPMSGRIDLLCLKTGQENDKHFAKEKILAFSNEQANFNKNDLFEKMSHDLFDEKNTDLLIIDFKTGDQTILKLSEFCKTGKGLQLIFYALAMESLGFKNVSCSIVNGHSEFSSQNVISLKEATQDNQIWQIVSKIAKTGVFGQIQTANSDYGFSFDLPIATLQISEEILRKKREKWLS